MKKFFALLLTAAMLFAITACDSKQNDNPDQKNNDAQNNDSDTAKVYAVEAGSAGEEVANENNWKINSVGSQADALMEVASGTSDAAIIDLLMAGAMIGEGTSYPDLKYTDKLTTEEYGIGCRKGSDLASYINAVLAETYASGKMQEIAKTYNITEDVLIPQSAVEFTPSSENSDVAYIQNKGTLVVGITDFAPMDYEEVSGSGNWIGFDADMAKLVAEKLGVTCQFIVIDWDMKTNELDGKTIDVVWNGMTLTDGVKAAMECTNAYCQNAQVVVTK